MENNLRKRRRVAISDFDETLTEQSHSKHCNIGNILNKYKKTGMLTHVNSMQGRYEDFPNSVDFHAMQNVIANAKSMFESIPSHIRSMFDNDPSKFLDFAQNPENREEMLDLGFSDEHLPAAVEPPTVPGEETPLEAPPVEPGSEEPPPEA